ncbi:hypothetical protein HY637_05110 [Candidatus Woesearchaeota archaeon]|nr:hypothetical protein [Candidatus Woesearchaeota archaeon]
MAKSERASPHHDSHFYEKPLFQYALIAAILLTLLMSALAFVNTSQLKKALVPDTISPDDFLKKLTSHPEMKAYVGVAPLNIIQINSNNFANLRLQITGLDATYIGNFIVQYTDAIAVYDYEKDEIRGTVSLQQPQQSQLPQDFSVKLNKHPELKGLKKEQPIGGQLDESSLSTLRQQFPDVYKDAKVGDFLLRYSKKLIIYDYNADRIVNAVNLQ